MAYVGKSAADFDFEALPPEDAVDYFERKGYQVGFAWQDVWQDEHARAFTVAKAMTTDLLQDIRGVVDSAIAAGIAFDDFKKNLTPILRARGWWGRQIMRDPLTGEDRSVQLGSVRRLRTIYNTNLRTSYAAGNWEQIQRTKHLLPYLRYVDPDARPRPEHLDWSGTVLPADDPWWATHFTPNGWECKCYVDSFSKADLDRYDYAVNDSAPPDEQVAYVNPRTGAISMHPKGIDPGFGYNVGQAGINYAAEKTLAEKLAAADPDVRAAIEKIPAPPKPHVNPTPLQAVERGRQIAQELGGLPSGGAAAREQRSEFRARLLNRLDKERGIGGVAPAFSGGGRGKGAELVRQAASRYPDAWVAKSNEVGKIEARLSRGRGFHRRGHADAFGNFDSVIVCRNRPVAIHEYAHRLQAAMPGLDHYFRHIHALRTEGEQLVSLRSLRPGWDFRPNEMTRQDRYADPYFGKEYGAGNPQEVITMTYQSLLSGGYDELDETLIRAMLERDPELLHLAIGLLFEYAP